MESHSSGAIVVRVNSGDTGRAYVIIDGPEGGTPPIRSEVLSADGLRALWTAIGRNSDELADAVSTADLGWELARSLTSMASVLQANGQEFWAEKVARAAGDAPFKPGAAAAQFTLMLGGMGSLNDLILAIDEGVFDDEKERAYLIAREIKPDGRRATG